MTQLESAEVHLPDFEPVQSALDPGAEVDVDQIAFVPEIFEKLLQNECKLWQKKLRLQDWNVRVRLCRLHEMPDRDCIGAIRPVMERKDANLLLLSPMDAPLVQSGFLADEEMNYGLTIVHELLHLHLYAFAQDLTPEQTVAEEQAVNAMSRCIVAAYASQVKPLTHARAKPAQHGHYL
jgi:hypothetical protein